MSYDFTGLTDDELEKQLAVVDDRRIWVIAEALRRGVKYEHIHEITKIDLWFIDKIAILVEMENRLKTEELTVDLLKEAKRIEFPDMLSHSLQILMRLISRRCVTTTALWQPTRWLIPVLQSLKQRHHTTTQYSAARMRRQRQIHRKRCLYLVQDLSVSTGC